MQKPTAAPVSVGSLHAQNTRPTRRVTTLTTIFNAKTLAKLSALLLFVSIIISFSFTRYCNGGTSIDGIEGTTSTTYYLSIISTILGSFMTVVLYKVFNETESALSRRLERLNRRKNVGNNNNNIIDTDDSITTSTGTTTPNNSNNKKPVKVWLDGAFDLTHLGHFNAFRQAKACGDVLYVGLNPDDEIFKYKGPTILTNAERKTIIESCKFVDVAVENVPYVMNTEYLEKEVFGTYGCDFVLHGDDPCLTPDGQDVFAAAKQMKKYMNIKRTESVSTTEICGRLLTASKAHLFKYRELESDGDDDDEEEESTDDGEANNENLNSTTQIVQRGINTSSWQRITTFLPTSRRFMQFLGNSRRPEANDTVVYCSGTWDLFSFYHVEFLQKVREQCAAELEQEDKDTIARGETPKKRGNIYLIVGIYDDNVANFLHGFNFPILNIYERSLSALSCKYIDDVIIGPPYVITKEFLTNFNIQRIYAGTVSDTLGLNPDYKPQEDPYALPKTMNIFHTIVSPNKHTIKDITMRVAAQRKQFEAKYERKSKAEAEYVQNQEFVQEL